MQCADCGATVPGEARFCPQCGKPANGFPTLEQAIAEHKRVSAPDRARRAIRGLVALAMIIVAALGLLSFCSPSAEELADEAAKEEAAAAQEAADRVKGFHCLSSWDGSNRSLVDQIKKRLRDPDSFKHAETRITPVSPKRGGKHVAMMTYHARNGFGGMNVATAVGLIDPTTCSAEVVSAGE